MGSPFAPGRGARIIATSRFYNPLVGAAQFRIRIVDMRSIWPMVALLIPEHQLGTAYGVMRASLNLGMLVVDLARQYILTTGFEGTELFYLVLIARKF